MRDCNDLSSLRIPGLEKRWATVTDDQEFVCSKIPQRGTVLKDCQPKSSAPDWYTFLFDGCNGGVCYCDDGDGFNGANRRVEHRLWIIAILSILMVE